MDKYKRAAKPRPQEPIKENEIRITAQGHIRNYISYATCLLQEKRTNEIVLKAMGQAISKTVAITEIIKKRIPGLYQETSISSTSITDVWEPIEEGLIPLEIARQVSLITVTLSTTELNKNSPGYQAPSNLEQPILVQHPPRQHQPQQRQQQPQQRQQQPQQRQQQPQQRQQQPQQRQQRQQQQQHQPRQLHQQQHPRQQQHPQQLHPQQQYQRQLPSQQQQWQLSEQAYVPTTDANQDSYGGRSQGRGRGRGRGRGWGRGGYENYQENDGYNNWGRGGGRGGSRGYRGAGYERGRGGGGGGGGRGYGRGRGRMRGQGRVGGYQAEF